MLLQRLKEYADHRLSLPPTFYSEVVVRYIIELDRTGRLLSPRPTDTADPASPRARRGQRRLAPQVQRTFVVKPLLLADNAEYTLRLAREQSNPDRVAACQRAYLELLDRCLSKTREPSVQAVLDFLRTDSSTPSARLELPEDFDRGATITFRVNSMFPIDLPSVRAFWAIEHDPAQTTAPVMQCLVCGQERPVPPRLQAKIKGVPGGKNSGTSIISANEPAFESYGLEASLNAPACAECAERFTQAANSLLASQTNQLRLGGAAFIFWTREDVGFNVHAALSEPQPEDVQALIASVRTGRRTAGVDDTAFYAAVFSGSGGRVVVRDWMDTTVGQVKDAMAMWFQRQSIVSSNGGAPRPLGINALAFGTVRDPRDLAPPVPRALVSAALTGVPLQWELLYQAVRSNRAEQRVTQPRAALTKLVLLSHQPDNKAEDYMVQLEPNHPSTAYHCGRLLSVLEHAQRAALPGPHATIVDRFYGTASSAPAFVFSRLMRGVQPHLAILGRDRRGAFVVLQRRLEEILGAIPSFPRTLTLEEQGVFTLGYYHQRAHDRAQSREAVQRQGQGLPVEPDADLPLDPSGGAYQNNSENGEDE